MPLNIIGLKHNNIMGLYIMFIRMIMFTTATILIIFALHEVEMSSLENPLQSTIAKRATLTSEQFTCIENSVVTELDGSSNAACRNIAINLRLLYNSFDIVGPISRGLDNFPELCRPECGQVLINIWNGCNAFDDVKDVANLLIGMCASEGGTTCYSNFNELFQYLNDGRTCYNSLIDSGTCSSQCSTRLADGIRKYGCCVNVPIDYFVAHADVQDEVNTVVSGCDVSPPARCANSPLSAGSHTVGVAVNIGIIAVLAAWQLM